MSAYAALVSLMNDLDLIPIHPIHSFSFDDKQITSLSQTVHFLIDFMETYNSHGCSREAADVLENRIASSAHAAHDVIECHVVDQIHVGSTLGRNSRPCFLLDLQKAIDYIDLVKREVMQFKAESGLKAEQLLTYSPSTSSEPLISEKNHMVGFDVVVFRLLEMLTVTGELSSQRVIPIVGMGGMGKTTLAKNVYDHLLIERHFDVRLWATISLEYTVETIFTQLLFREARSANGGNASELGLQLHKMLWGRRYLIVLDDMWNVEAWNEVQMFLPNNGNGSCVIVTTRLSNLATHLSSSSPFEMEFLDDDQSWELFCGKTFGEEDCPVELEEIGKKIVKRCRGLPLSIVVIGGHLRRSSRLVEYWEKVANIMNPVSSLGADHQCLQIISLSYHHLPACLKPCFLYMGIFHEDERIDASILLRFWVAEGFVKVKRGLSLEEVAEEYLKDLIDRNLILVRERKWNGKVKNCIVHDILRELCLKITEKEKFMGVLGTTEGIGRERRVVIPKGKLNSDAIGALESAVLVRSIRRQGVWFSDEVSIDLRSLRLLRVSANVNNMSLKKNGRCYPATNLQQLNLRYLTFSCEKSNLTERPYLPSSISLFWNMQTLVINNFDMQISAPYEIWEMPQLRHLEFRGFYLPDPLPRQQKRIVLENLHTLVGVENLRLTEEVCKRMPNIVDLSAFYDNFPSDCEASSYYCPHNLGRFNKLKSLKCEFGDDSKWRDVALSFTFPTSLEELCLWNSNLHWEDLTMMIKSLPHLGLLKLNLIQEPEWVLAEEEFTCLKVLWISNCEDLVHWNANSSNFPVLEIVRFWTIPELGEIPSDLGEIPTLRLIELYHCSVAAAVSAMRIVVEQESLGNQDLQLEVHFCEMEEAEGFRKMVKEEDLSSNNLRLHLPWPFELC